MSPQGPAAAKTYHIRRKVDQCTHTRQLAAAGIQIEGDDCFVSCEPVVTAGSVPIKPLDPTHAVYSYRVRCKGAEYSDVVSHPETHTWYNLLSVRDWLGAAIHAVSPLSGSKWVTMFSSRHVVR